MLVLVISEGEGMLMASVPKTGKGPRDLYISNVPADVLEWLRVFAAEDQRSLTAQVRIILAEYVEQRRSRRK